MLELLFERDTRHFEPGETSRLELSWQSPSEIEWLELRLVCNTVGKGDQDLSVVQVWKNLAPAAQGHQTLFIDLPTAPYSFSGKLISLIWAFELVSFPQEESCRHEITIAPQGHEILLPVGEK